MNLLTIEEQVALYNSMKVAMAEEYDLNKKDIVTVDYLEPIIIPKLDASNLKMARYRADGTILALDWDLMTNSNRAIINCDSDLNVISTLDLSTKSESFPTAENYGFIANKETFIVTSNSFGDNIEVGLEEYQSIFFDSNIEGSEGSGYQMGLSRDGSILIMDLGKREAYNRFNDATKTYDEIDTEEGASALFAYEAVIYDDAHSVAFRSQRDYYNGTVIYKMEPYIDQGYSQRVQELVSYPSTKSIKVLSATNSGEGLFYYLLDNDGGTTKEIMYVDLSSLTNFNVYVNGQMNLDKGIVSIDVNDSETEMVLVTVEGELIVQKLTDDVYHSIDNNDAI